MVLFIKVLGWKAKDMVSEKYNGKMEVIIRVIGLIIIHKAKVKFNIQMDHFI